jgi:hypothetical protein
MDDTTVTEDAPVTADGPDARAGQHRKANDVLSGEGQAAVAAYGRIQELERELDAARGGHAAAVALMPAGDTDLYFAATDRLRNPDPVGGWAVTSVPVNARRLPTGPMAAIPDA